MRRQRILITGASGLVGSYFCRMEELTKCDVYCTVHNEPVSLGKTIPIDFRGPSVFVEKAIKKIKPDIIVNLAAMTDVELCEIKKNEADRINHLLVRQLAKYIENNQDCFLVHVSTDYVFNGEKGNYDENDDTNPINWYGMTKLLGEQELIKNCQSRNWCIARTSTPFGVHSKKQSFPLFIIRNLRNGQEINVLVDQMTSPTYAQNMAEMLFEIVERRISGIFHLSGASQMTRFEQAVEIARIFQLDQDKIKPLSIRDMNWKARRPLNSSLNVGKISRHLSNKPMGFIDSLGIFAMEFQ